MAVLRGCPEAVIRLLRSGGSVLLAANIMVLSRLLHKKLSQREDPPPYLEVLRQRLATLRRKLLTRIDRRFQSLDASESDLIEAMCAHSLTTSSSAADVLRHFHHVRGSTLSELGKRQDDDRSIFKSLRILVKTLKDCQVMMPAMLSRALEKLKSIELLQNSDVRSLLELNLDIHQRWLGDDINNFVPYIRHDDLQKSEADGLLKQWTRQAFSSFIKYLRDKIAGIRDPAAIIKLRQEVLEIWFSNQRIQIGVDTSEVLEDIRDAFDHGLKDLIHQHCAGLRTVASTIDLCLNGWERGVSDACPTMWGDAITTIDAASSVGALKEALYIRAYGKSPSMQSVSSTYTTWIGSINGVEKVISSMRQKKWVDDLDETDDEDVLENRQVLLSEDDPRFLQETLNEALKQNLQLLEDAIQAHAEDLNSKPSADVEAGRKSCFLLRVSRDIMTKLPASYPNSQDRPKYIAVLQAQIARSIMQQPLSRCLKRIAKSSHQKQLQILILWEGDPQLPVLPSPYAFRLLHDIVRSMTALGADIWTPGATSILKRQLRDALAPVMGELPKAIPEVNGDDKGLKSDGTDNEGNANGLEGNGNSASPADEQNEIGEGEQQEDMQEAQQITKPNGELPTELEEPSEEVARNMRIQRLFDVLYLQNAASIKDSDGGEDPLDRTRDVISKSIDLADRDFNRIRRNAEAYWKRTELLFALMA